MSATPDDGLGEVSRLLGEQAGIDAESLGTTHVAQVVRKHLSEIGVASPHELCTRLAGDPRALQQFLEDLLVAETWFFRHALAFRSLTQRLLDSRASRSDAVRVLSIACSTGEEVYSLALTLREAGLEPPQFSILGVDLSRAALETAQAGIYGTRSFRTCDEGPTGWRERWCAPVGDAWQVRVPLRAGVDFRWANLASRDFLSGEAPFRAIFCRNVLIYLDGKARHTALGHVRRLLCPEGCVWSAPAEANLLSNAGFDSVGKDCCFAFGSPQRSVPRPAMSPNVPAARPRDSRKSISAARLPSRPAVVTVEPTPSASEPTSLEAARAAADEGRLDEADALCERILAEEGACTEAHHLRGLVRQAQGLFREAQQSFEKALYLDPHHYPSLLHLMLLAQRRGDALAAANYRRRVEQTEARKTP